MPFKSRAQQRYMNAQRGKEVPSDVVDEWNQATKGKYGSLPDKVSKKSGIDYTRNAHYTAQDVHHFEPAEPPEPAFVKAAKRKHPGKVQTQPQSYKRGKVGWSSGLSGDDGYMRPGGGKRDVRNLSTGKSAGTKPHNIGNRMRMPTYGGGKGTQGKMLRDSESASRRS